MTRERERVERVISEWVSERVQANLAFHHLNKAAELKFGLSLVQYHLLSHLREMPGCAPQGLAATAGMHPSTLTQSLRRLSRKGAVFVSRDPRDSRRKVLSLTRKGKELMDSFDQGRAYLFESPHAMSRRMTKSLVFIGIALLTASSSSSWAAENRKTLLCKGPLISHVMLRVGQTAPGAGSPAVVSADIEVEFQPMFERANFSNVTDGRCGFTDRSMTADDGRRVKAPDDPEGLRLFQTHQATGSTPVSISVDPYTTAASNYAKGRYITIEVVPGLPGRGAWRMDPNTSKPPLHINNP